MPTFPTRIGLEIIQQQREGDITVVILFYELSEILLEVSHSIRRDENLEPRVSTRECLWHLETMTILLMFFFVRLWIYL